MSESNKKSNKFINIILFIIIIFLGIYFYSSYIEVKKLIIKEYKVESTLIPQNFDGIKIVHFSDIFYYSTTTEDELKMLVNKINMVKPDIVIFTGNLVSPSSKLKDIDKNRIINIFNDIDVKLGKYAVKGDSDYKVDNYEEIMNQSGFIVLNNSYDLIFNENYKPIFIGGLSSNRKDIVDLSKVFSYYVEPEEAKKEEIQNVENINKAEYKIVLFSESDLADKVVEYDPTVNLMLSGNSLNGCINMFNLNKYFVLEGSKKYYQEYYKIGNSDLYVSSGIGTNTFKHRFNNFPSFNVYRLKTI